MPNSNRSGSRGLAQPKDGRTLRWAFCALALAPVACGPEGGGPARPNIVLIMADDLGAETLGCYGNTAYSTPRLDAMASDGARYENAFATPVCSPTRSMVLTGLHPNRTGILERLDSPLDPDRTNRLPAHIGTLADALKSAGYATAIAGKWHLGHFQSYPDQPSSHGFDEYSLWVQYWDGERRSRYYAPHVWEKGAYRVHGRETFGPDHFSSFLLDFIGRNRDRPFFAYYPMNLVHTPLVTPPSLGELAGRRYPDDLGTDERKAGHMITYMDAIVGRFLDKIRELGLERNTLVLFTGDNGSAVGLESRLGDLRVQGGKRTMNEAGTRVPLIAHWPGTVPPGVRHSFFSLLDMMPTLCRLAGAQMAGHVDGLDLSHTLLGKPGRDREFFPMAFEGELFFVRDRRFRLHEDGRLYDVPVGTDAGRYSMDALVQPPRHAAERLRLQGWLEDFKQVRKSDGSYEVVPYGTGGDRFKNAQDAARAPR